MLKNNSNHSARLFSDNKYNGLYERKECAIRNHKRTN